LGLLKHVLLQFDRDRCLVTAGMLTYATLLSLVPLMVVVVSIVAALPGAEAWGEQIQNFAFENFVPAAREEVQQKLDEIIQVLRNGQGGLTATMGFFLLVTALILMHHIENAMNRTFGVKSARSLVNKFVVYWSALSLGPILLGASLALSSIFFSLQIINEVRSVGPVGSLMQSITPFMVGALAFFMTFMIVPNRRVPWKPTLIAAITTAILFELAKKGFGLYVSTFDGYTRLYGALAAIPIFLVWVHLAWSIILFGATLAASLGVFRMDHEQTRWPEQQMFILLYRLLEHLWQAQQKGQGLTELALFKLEPDAGDDQIQQLLENLRQADVLRRDEAGEWVLVRDLSQFSIADLYASGHYVMPLTGELDPDRVSVTRLEQALQEITLSNKALLDKSVTSFYGPPGLRKAKHNDSEKHDTQYQVKT